MCYSYIHRFRRSLSNIFTNSNSSYVAVTCWRDMQVKMLLKGQKHQVLRMILTWKIVKRGPQLKGAYSVNSNCIKVLHISRGSISESSMKKMLKKIPKYKLDKTKMDKHMKNDKVNT